MSSFALKREIIFPRRRTLTSFKSPKSWKSDAAEEKKPTRLSIGMLAKRSMKNRPVTK